MRSLFLRHLLAPAIALVVTAAAWAADPAPPAGTELSDEAAAAQALALAKARLQLTPYQTERIKPLMDAQVKKLRALFVSYTGGGAAVLPSFFQEFKQTRDDFRANVQPILTESQRAGFDQLRKEVDEALRDLICDQRVAALKQRLTLTPEQETALRPILKEDFDKKRELLALHTGPSGGPQGRKWGADEMNKIQAGTETRMRGVLSPAQMQTYLEDLGRERQAAGATESGMP
jgi:hypothetical protein